MIGNKEKYAVQIRMMQDMIAEISEKNVLIQAEENRLKLEVDNYAKRESITCNVTIDEILEPGFTDRTPQEANKAMNTELLRIFQSYNPDEQKKILKTLRLWKRG